MDVREGVERGADGVCIFFFQAEDGIRDLTVTGVQTCALPIWTTLDDYLSILDFVEEVGWIDNVSPVQYTIRLLLPPGSSLLGRPQTEGLLGRLDEAQFTYEWRHPDPRMDDLHVATAALVEQAEAAGEDPRLTFYRLKNLAPSVAPRRGA